MKNYLSCMKEYWNERFGGEGRIWGSEPSTTAIQALNMFQQKPTTTVLVPGSGYGRNSKLFSDAGFEVTGIEISSEAITLARLYDFHSKFFCASFMDISLAKESYDAIYCFNVLHLFRQHERSLFVQKCHHALKKGGVAFFVVFSDLETSFGKGQQVETNTFESKPGRPVHYYTEQDLKIQFDLFSIIDTGIAEDSENHGNEGPHIHIVRYIVVEKI
jgi:SAM-dependent methyltransferase